MVIDGQFTVATADGGVEAGNQWDNLNAEAADNPLMVTEYSRSEERRVGTEC